MASGRLHAALGLRGEGARVRDATRDPCCELALGSQALRVHSEPAPHFAAAHLEWSRMRLRKKGVGLRGVDTHHQAALTAGRNGHVSTNQKGQATEHLLLRDFGVVGDQLADAIGEVFLIRHGDNMIARRQGWCKLHRERHQPALLLCPKQQCTYSRRRAVLRYD